MKTGLFVSVRNFFVGLSLSFMTQASWASSVTMHYDSLNVCKGDEFSLHDFIENRVVVPIDCRLIGWRDESKDIVSIDEDTVFYLQYTENIAPEIIKELSLRVYARDYPKVSIEENILSVCKGSLFPEVSYTTEDCDCLYWLEVESGREEQDFASFGVVHGSGRMHYLLVGSNDNCPLVAQDELILSVTDPKDFRLSIALPEEKYNICGDTVSLCDFIHVQDAKLYLSDRFVRTVPVDQIWLTWQTEDEYSRCDSLVRESYSNNYHIQLEVVEPYCSTKVVLDESHLQEFICVGDSMVNHAVSFSCSLSKGTIYLGAQLPILDVTFESLLDISCPLPRMVLTERYNMDTYMFPYKANASVCLDDQIYDEMIYKVNLLCLSNEGDSVMIVDTIKVKPCKKNPPLFYYDCDSDPNGFSTITIASMDSIVNVDFVGRRDLLRRLEKENRKGVPDFYSYLWSYSVDWESAALDTIHYEVDLSYASCSGESIHTTLNVEVSNCRKEPSIYYGAFSSPSSILLQRKECLQHQCSNEREKDASVVDVTMDCYGDTLYFKFKGMDFELDDHYMLRVQSPFAMNVVYPAEYDEVDNNVFEFYNVDKMNPILSFVPTDDCVIHGDLSGVPFTFNVRSAQKIVADTYEVCSGDTVDLNALVGESRGKLSWNVTQTRVVLQRDMDFYLYGYTSKGCLVDEKVHMHVNHPLWYESTDRKFCGEQRLMVDELLHTNAVIANWYGREEEELDVANGLWVDSTIVYTVDLYGYCDTATYTFKVEVDDCEKKQQALMIPLTFSPNGDGVDDVWRLIVPDNVEEWECWLFDRFGKVLAEYHNRLIEWDGTYRGNMMPSTDYWYFLRLGKEEKTGHFTLLR